MGENVYIHAPCSNHERFPAFVRVVGELARSEVALVRETRGEAEGFREQCEVAAFARLAERQYRPATRMSASFGCDLASGLGVGMIVDFSDDAWGAPWGPGTLRGDVDREAFARRSGVRPRYAPWEELAEVAVTQRAGRDDTFALLASFGRALGEAGSGVVSIAGEYAADVNAEAFAARFRNPALLLEACAAGTVLTEARSSALRGQDPARVWSALEALAVPDEQELALDAIVLRAQQLLAVAEETEVVTFALSRRDQQRLPRAPKWKVVLEDDGAASVVCRRSGSLAAFYEVLAEFLLTTRD